MRDVTGMESQEPQAQDASQFEEQSSNQGIEPSADSGTEGSEQPKVTGWESDKRYETMWGKDPNKAYESYKNMETQMEKISRLNKEYESRVREREAEIEKYKPGKQVLDFFESNPKYQELVVNALKEAKKQEQEQKYGAPLNPQIYGALEKSERVERELMKMKEERQVQEISSRIDSSLNEIDSIAKKYELEWDRRDFLTYCNKNNVPPEYMVDKFTRLAHDKITEIVAARGQSAIKGNIQSNRAKSIPSGSGRVAPSGGKSAYDQIVEAYKRGG